MFEQEDRKMRLITGLIVIALVGWTTDGLHAEESANQEPTTTAATTEGEPDEEWLNTVWTQVDDMVKQESLELQKTVTVAGVRGAEAEDSILDKLYYKGAKRYPSQDKLRKAVDSLKQALGKAPKGPNAAKQKFFIAQCYEKLGQTESAKDFYGQVASDHPESSFAEKAGKRVGALQP